MKRKRLRKTIRKEPVRLLIGDRTYTVPFDVATYVTDLHQLLLSVHTRVKKERSEIINHDLFVEKPRIVRKRK